MAKSLLPLGGFRCVGRAARPLFARPAVMLFRMRQLEAHCREWCMDAAVGAAKGGTAGYVPAGLLPIGVARALAVAAFSALSAPAGLAKEARAVRGAAAHGRVREARAALCSMRAAGRRALLSAGP